MLEGKSWVEFDQSVKEAILSTSIRCVTGVRRAVRKGSPLKQSLLLVSIPAKLAFQLCRE